MTISLIIIGVFWLGLTFVAGFLPHWKTTKIKGNPGRIVNFDLWPGQNAIVESVSVALRAQATRGFTITHPKGNTSSEVYTSNDHHFSGSLMGGIWTVKTRADGVHFELYPDSRILILISTSLFEKFIGVLGSTIMIGVFTFIVRYMIIGH